MYLKMILICHFCHFQRRFDEVMAHYILLQKRKQKDIRELELLHGLRPNGSVSFDSLSGFIIAYDCGYDSKI